MTLSTDTLDTATLAHLQSWTGNTETLLDQATAAPVGALWPRWTGTTLRLWRAMPYRPCGIGCIFCRSTGIAH